MEFMNLKVLIGNVNSGPMASSLLPGHSYFELRSPNDYNAEVKGEGHIPLTSKQRSAGGLRVGQDL